MLQRLYFSLLASLMHLALSQAQFNNPTGVDIWCGKAYRPSNDSFNPGGWFEEPEYSTQPRLRLKAKPRMSIYLESDTQGAIIVDANIGYQLGEPIASNQISNLTRGSSVSLKVEILSDRELLTTATVSVGSTNNEIIIELNRFPASLESYNITVRATLPDSAIYTTSTDLYRLPYPEDYGSVSRVDNLFGGLWVKRGNQSAWESIFPYTYYVQWSLYWDSNVTTLDEFAAMGYNLIHIVPTGTLGESPFPWDQFQPYLNRASELGLFFQYDVLWDPMNETAMVEQVTRLRTHPSILLWYQSDEADGKGNPINSTGIAREKMWELDPYHPSSLALNCYDFYYADYAKGGEIILSDVYPISTNTSWSTVYETPCNATYGCCGCDDCDGVFEDISDRIDEFHRRDEIIGWQKTQWAAPQAFGNETFWTRYPTAAEEVVMALLAVNHGAKGLVAWNFPTTAELSRVTQALAKILTSDDVGYFLLQTPLSQRLAVSGGTRVDAAVWISKERNQALLSVINLNYGDLNGKIRVTLPSGVEVKSISKSLWGDVNWEIVDGSTLLSSSGLLGLQVSLITLKLSN